MLKFLSKSVKKLFGTKFDKDVAIYQPMVDQALIEYEKLSSLSDDALRNKTLEFRSRIKEYLSEVDKDIEDLTTKAADEKDIQAKEDIYEDVDKLKKDRNKHLEVVLKEILPEAFAVVKETARRFTENSTITVTATEHDRDIAVNNNYVMIDGDKATWKNSWEAAGAEITWNMIHYDVQLIGGMVLHDGKIAEMQTGEGKTLVATLPAYLNGLTGEGVHIITVNDYLARRDSEWIGPLLEFLYLTVDCIDKYKPHSEGRKAAYKKDVTYGTNNEFGFDYLRDNMVVSLGEKVQQKHHYAMIDEVDSVLIDDARTPLIISGPVPKGDDEQEYMALKPEVEVLIEAQRKIASKYLAEGKKFFKDGVLGSEEGEAGLSLLRAYRALPKNRPLIKFLSEEGVKVEMQKAENHYMQEQSKNMHIADEPLLFTIDEKNRNVELTERGADFLSSKGSDPNFFVMPDIALELQQLEDTEYPSLEQKTEAKDKLLQDYTVKSKRLHTMSQLLKAYTLFEKDTEYVVMDDQVKIVDEQTGRMMEGRRYSDGLHQALEAKENVKVGNITQTYATITLQNYFRMFHKLAGMTGTAETEAGEFWEIYKLDVVVIPTNRPIIRADKDDLVYKTEREKFNAVSQDIIKLSQAGRPVLVGTTSVDISEKLSRMLNMQGITHNVLNAKQHQREADIVTEAGKAGQVTIATNMAGRGTDIKLSKEVIEAGGLAIIGTERHDSRRVDRQLRGRAGRQGDAGSSQFYISLEDNLMRLFQSERLAKVMDRMGHQEGEVLQHSMVSKSIERAQKKVEENNFGIRKRLLDYDDVMNIQREAIYRKRNNALAGDRLAVDINSMFSGLTENLVYDFKQQDDFEGFRTESMRLLGVDPEISEGDFISQSLDNVIDQFQAQVAEKYNRKSQKISEALLPIIQEVHKNEGHKYKRIAIPFTDGRQKPLPVSATLEDAIASDGKSIMRDVEKAITLAIIDDEWKEHLRSMDELKDAVQASSFEQKDPLVVYKMEAYNYFEGLMNRINEKATSYLIGGDIVFRNEQKSLEQAKESRTDLSRVQTNRREEDVRARAAAAGANRQPQKPVTFKRVEKKVGRNEPCPCGSGKKFKQCHGKL
jgi:preprotein translocase subunit SecA